MEWSTGLRLLKGFGLGGAALLMVSMFAFHEADPTVINLRYPMGGVANLVGLPGALTGGSLVEFLGGSALWLPVLLVSWFLSSRNRISGAGYLILGAATIAISATLQGLYGQELGPGPGLHAPGLVGMAGSRWVHLTTGGGLGFLILGLALGYSLWHLYYRPWMGVVLREAGALGGYLALRGAAGMGLRIMALSRGAGRIMGKLRALSQAALSQVPVSLTAQSLSPRRAPSLGVWPSRAHPHSATVGKREGNHSENPEGGLAPPDGFDTWFVRGEEGPPDGKPIEKT